MFFTERGKTGVPVGGALSNRAIKALLAYIAHLGVDLHGEAYIFRNRSGAPYSSCKIAKCSSRRSSGYVRNWQILSDTNRDQRTH
jgi:hypothetical protein